MDIPTYRFCSEATLLCDLTVILDVPTRAMRNDKSDEKVSNGKISRIMTLWMI